ncbi:MAG: hypothetical protein Dasosvirus1_13 [Dasosvirus sp.]|uniref:Uncharacterized protein n=1 Tax=Dasosvirus sp. TaxID=2487764 RepID=A0A3G4ZR52_9VIRU|nr:MAG: hypothetical protein Dasosvirus1_13 [Dasosvirus sp.]
MSEPKPKRRKISDVTLFMAIDGCIFHCAVNENRTITFGDATYCITVKLLKLRKYNISVIKSGCYENYNKEQIDKESTKWLEYEKTLESALKKTNDNIKALTNEFYKKLTQEQEFGKKFIEESETLLAVLSGDLRVSTQSEEKLKQQIIEVQQLKSEEISWIMNVGKHYKCEKLRMDFWLSETNTPDLEIKQNFEKVQIFAPSPKVEEIHLDESMLRDVFLDDLDKIVMERMKVYETDDSYICEYLIKNTDGYVTRISPHIKISKRSGRVHPIKRYEMTDIKNGEQVMAFECSSRYLQINCCFVGGKITKTINEKGVFFNVETRLQKHSDESSESSESDSDSDDSTNKKIFRTVLDQIWKLDDIPERFRHKLFKD